MKNNKLIAIVLLYLVACLVGGALLPYGVILAKDESSVDASVTVKAAAGSYGASIMGSDDTLLPRLALGKPDHAGAVVYRKGWMEIKLEKTVTDCAAIDIWAASFGLGKSEFTLYTSDTGKKWTKAGTLNINRIVVDQYEITGNFKNVGYIKVARNGSSWSIGVVDAVGAKGGDK